MQVRVHPVTRVRNLSGDAYVLRVTGPFPPVEGGQFAMLSTCGGWPVLLPRPFSYFDVEAGPDGFATFFGKAVGPGTRALREVSPGDEVLVSGPLGRGFPEAASAPVCIAGGVGLAPFLLWAKDRQAAGGSRVPVLYGGATHEAIVAMDEFAEGAQSFHVATDDGSLGFHGNVLELYESLVASGEVDGSAPVYCCGPDPMMEAVAAACRRRGVECWVSLETYMACGYGACNGCSVRVHSGERFGGKTYARACVHGPVFTAEELGW